MEPLRVGIAGAGLMGRWHGDAALACGARVEAVVDPDPAAARALARKLGAAATFDDVAALADAAALPGGPRIDVLHVCAPLPSHAGICERALEAGIHVLVEKPLAATRRETERLVRLAEKARRRLCPVHQYLFQDGYRRARGLVPRPGRTFHLDFTICSAGADGGAESGAVGGTRRGADGLRDSILVEVFPHPLSIVRDLVAAPTAEVAWRVESPEPGEFRAQGRAGGATISVLVSLSARPTESSLVIRGEGGTVHVDFFHGFAFAESARVSRGRKIARPFDQAMRRAGAAGGNLTRRALRREPAYPGLRTLVREFYDSVRGGTDAPISPDAAIDVAAARDRWIEALATARSPS